MILTAALLSLFNMARGQGLKNPDGNDGTDHGVWVIVSAWIIYCETLDLWQTALWMFVVVITTIRATKSILAGINNDKKSWMAGYERNLLIIPALMFLNSFTGFVLLLQGFLYYFVGKWEDGRATRVAEGLYGALLGLIVISS